MALTSACRTGFNDTVEDQIQNTAPTVSTAGTNRGDPEIFTLTPSQLTVVINTSRVLTASNGTPPYLYSMVTGSGSIGSASGQYSAPAAPGSSIVKVQDSVGRVAMSTITINPVLGISPAQQYVLKNTSYQIPVTGGVPPYFFALASGAVGEVGQDGSFLSTDTGAATVVVTDSAGSSARAALSVYDPLQIKTDKTVTVVSSPVQLGATGGVPPYAYTVAEGKGAIDSSQKFLSSETGPFPTQDQVCVTDTQNNKSCQSLQIVSTIIITALSTEIAVGNAIDLTVTGGVAPFVYQEVTPSGALGTLSACATPSARCMNFKADAPGKSTIQVTDADNTTNQIIIVIDPPISLSPASVGLPASTAFTLVVSGGVPHFSYSSTAGTMSGPTLTTPATLGGLTVTVTDAMGNTATSKVNVTTTPDWPGIATVTALSPTSVKVTWLPYNSPNGFLITWAQVSCTPSVFNNCQTQSAVDPTPTDTSYIITGLTPNTLYQFAVFINGGGGGGGSVRTLQQQTGNVSVLHMGWNDAQATGAVNPAPGSGLGARAAQVRLGWNPMQPSDPGATINGYNIYRGLSSGAETVIPLNSTPIIPQSSTSPVSYTDTSNLLYAQDAYYYVVKPIVDGLEVSASGTQNPTEIKVVIPPDNMVLVHRWIANQSMCAMLGQSTHPNASYSCSFDWPGGGTTFDVGSGTQTGFFVDAFETGCNYSRGACSNTGNSSKDCIGNGAPGALGVAAAAGSVYYDRYSGTCFVSASGSWVEAAGASQSAFLALASNQPGLPPLVRAPQSQAAAACQAFQKFLPSRLQQLMAAEWSSSVSNVSQLETGGGDNCNTDKAHGIAYETGSIPNNLETLPFAIASQGASPTAYTLRTGSTSTGACVSRYGAQDLVGNVNEWASDQVFCSAFVANTLGGVGYNCYGTATNLNGAASEFNNVYLSNNNASGTSDYWNLSASQALLAPLMVPVLASAGYASQQPASFSLGTQQCRFFGGANPGTRGVLTGGAWYGEDPSTGTQGAGRFSLDLSKFANTPDPSIGFRCAEPVM